MSIPKIIHYCWFGRGDYSDLIEKCIKSWHKNLPDYQFVLWNEDNFDINKNDFVKEAYENKKWAFVSDYVRLSVLYDYGGIYLDTDIMVLKNFEDGLLEYELLLGYTEDIYITSSFIGSSAKNLWIKTIKDTYENKKFEVDGELDTTINPLIFTKISMDKFGFKIGDSNIKGINSNIYPSEYFNPICKNVLKNKATELSKKIKNYIITENTYCVHLDSATWGNNTFFAKIKYYFLGTIRFVSVKNYIKTKKKLIEKKLDVNE